MLNRCHFGDCLEVMKTLPDCIVNTCVTSPPYFGLRDYGHDGQIGLESTPSLFVSKLVEVFREVHRLLRDDGTLWLNLGDSYAGSWGAQGRPQGESGQMADRSIASARQIHAHPKFSGMTGTRGREEGLKPKDLMGIPWRVAFALQQDGWYLRQDIIWHKPNPMPESVQDRCTKAHEYIFLLSKSEQYYYDAGAISVPLSSASIGRLAQEVESQEGSERVPGKTNGNMKAVGNERANKRSVWTVATTPYKGAHFATFPTELIEPCILAGAPSGGVVLDPFFGSGTTGQVAQNLGRQWIGCELNEEYAPLQRERLQQLGLTLE